MKCASRVKSLGNTRLEQLCTWTVSAYGESANISLFANSFHSLSDFGKNRAPSHSYCCLLKARLYCRCCSTFSSCSLRFLLHTCFFFFYITVYHLFCVICHLGHQKFQCRTLILRGTCLLWKGIFAQFPSSSELLVTLDGKFAFYVCVWAAFF